MTTKVQIPHSSDSRATSARTAPAPRETPTPATATTPAKAITTDTLDTPEIPDTAIPTTNAATEPEHARLVETIRTSWAKVEPRTPEMAQFFYSVLFTIAPDTRDLFPANMSAQRSRFLRALVHFVQLVDRTDELTPFLQQLGRDHRKFQVLERHYDAAGKALCTALQQFLGKDWTDEVAHAWTTAYDIIAGTMRQTAEEESGPSAWWATVLDHRRTSANVAVIRVQVSETLPYRPGDHLSVEIPQRPRLWRYLSPSNAPRQDGCIEFQVRAVPDGWVSQAMVNQTRPGDVWQLGPATGGNLTIAPDTDREQLIIAGGTGIAPMWALLEELGTRQHPPVVDLFFGGRTVEDLYDLARLRALASTKPWLGLFPVAEDARGTGIEQNTLAGAVTRRGNWPDRDILVAGSPAMIRTTVAKLLVAGCLPEQIHHDPFSTS